MASGDTSGIRYFTSSDSDDGDYTTALVAAVTGKKIRVMSLVATVLTTAGVLTLKSNSTAIFAHHLALGSPLVVDSNRGVCETASGEALVGSNATGVDSFISGSYLLVDA